MAGHDILLFLSLLLTLALLAEPLATRLHLPFSALLVLLGFLGSEIVVWGGFDTGIRFDDFHDLIVFVFLPVLVFAGALTIDPSQLRRNLPTILFLAVPILLLSTLAIAVLTLPVHLEYWWTIQSIAFGVVLFTLFVQTPTLPFLLRRLD